MNILVRQQAGFQFAGGFVYQSALAYTAVVGFVVLQTEVRDVIAEAEKKVVVAIVMSAEKFVCLFNQIFVMVPDFLAEVRARRRCRRQRPSRWEDRRRV